MLGLWPNIWNFAHLFFDPCFELVDSPEFFFDILTVVYLWPETGADPLAVAKDHVGWFGLYMVHLNVLMDLLPFIGFPTMLDMLLSADNNHASTVRGFRAHGTRLGAVLKGLTALVLWPNWFNDLGTILWH